MSRSAPHLPEKPILAAVCCGAPMACSGSSSPSTPVGCSFAVGPCYRATVTRKALDIYDGKDPRDIPAYTVPFAARLVGVSRSTLHAWVCGRAYVTKHGPRRAAAVIPPVNPSFLSFTNLVEAHVLSAMRKGHELDLRTVRRAVRYVEQELGTAHPLAREEFKTDGVYLFVEKFGRLINASQDGQLAIRDALEVWLTRIEYDAGRALRLFPFIRPNDPAQPKLIVIDSRRAFGRPVLKGTGIPVSAISERFRAGDSVQHLASDYRVPQELIEEAVRAA